MPSTIVARPRKDRTRAFLSSAPTPVLSRETIASFQAIGLGEVERRRRQRNADRVQGVRLDQGVDGVRRVNDRLRRDAADMQAGAAELTVLDQHRVEAEFAGADRRDIAARPAADDENLAAKLGHSVLDELPLVIASASESIQGPLGALRSQDCFALRARNDGLRVIQSSMKSVAGASISARTRWMKVAASWPSTTR